MPMWESHRFLALSFPRRASLRCPPRRSRRPRTQSPSPQTRGPSASRRPAGSPEQRMDRRRTDRGEFVPHRGGRVQAPAASEPRRLALLPETAPRPRPWRPARLPAADAGEHPAAVGTSLGGPRPLRARARGRRGGPSDGSSPASRRDVRGRALAHVVSSITPSPSADASRPEGEQRSSPRGAASRLTASSAGRPRPGPRVIVPRTSDAVVTRVRCRG